MKEKKRSIGVIAVGWSIIVFSITVILSHIIIWHASVHHEQLKGNVPSINWADFLISCYLFVAGILILKLNNSARIGAIGAFVYLGVLRYLFYCFGWISYYRSLETVTEILKLLNPRSFLDIGINIFYIYFFTRPKVKEQFK